MSLSGDKGVAQFKKSVKMEHPSDYESPKSTNSNANTLIIKDKDFTKYISEVLK